VKPSINPQEYLLYFEDLMRGFNAEMGRKYFFEIGSLMRIIFALVRNHCEFDIHYSTQMELKKQLNLGAKSAEIIIEPFNATASTLCSSIDNSPLKPEPQ